MLVDPTSSALPNLPLWLLPAARAQGTALHPEAWYLLLTKVASIKKQKDPKQEGLLPRRQGCASIGADLSLLGGLDSYRYLLLPRHPWG